MINKRLTDEELNKRRAIYAATLALIAFFVFLAVRFAPTWWSWLFAAAILMPLGIFVRFVPGPMAFTSYGISLLSHDALVAGIALFL